MATARKALGLVTVTAKKWIRAAHLLSTDLHSALKRAAELQGCTVTDFVVAADQECFAQALLSPPPPSPPLKRAFARRRKLLRTE